MTFALHEPTRELMKTTRHVVLSAAPFDYTGLTP
jgi:hypothetical protein